MKEKGKQIKRKGKTLDYTCENNLYKTDINKGYKHYKKHDYKGCVTETPLLKLKNSNSLWLEYVIDKQSKEKGIWLMWYDKNGYPAIPASAIIYLEHLNEVIKNFISILKLK
jgi:hypothetical protein